MILNIQTALKEYLSADDIDMHLSNVTLETDGIQAIMINEVVHIDPLQDFYGSNGEANYLKTTVPLFQKAGAQVNSIEEILSMGIYITNAVKTPKTEYAIEKSLIEKSLPVLEKEIGLFQNVKVIMLMGDVAKKAFNMISKKATGKNVIPAMSTYKLRNSEFYYGAMRIIPSYIMTGGNILIEKSKFEMASEDIKKMMDIIK